MIWSFWGLHWGPQAFNLVSLLWLVRTQTIYVGWNSIVWTQVVVPLSNPQELFSLRSCEISLHANTAQFSAEDSRDLSSDLWSSFSEHVLLSGVLLSKFCSPTPISTFLFSARPPCSAYILHWCLANAFLQKVWAFMGLPHLFLISGISPRLLTV